MNNKTDLIIMLLMIIGNINFSIALMLTPVSAPPMVILCVNIFCLLCLLGIYAHQLYNIHKGEKKELNNFMDELVNCPDRVAPPKFRKGDWITGIPGHIDDKRFLKVEDIITTDSRGTCYFIPDILSVVETFSGVIPAFIIDKWYRLASPEELQQNGITIDSNE